MSSCTVTVSSMPLDKKCDEQLTITVTPMNPNSGPRTITVVPVGTITIPRPPSGGKRGAVGPLVTTSDEDDSGPDSPRSESRESRATLSPNLLHDHDYENISSPSSTASGPTYVRQPGFTHHAHSVKAELTVSKPKVKKKKSQVLSVKDGITKQEPQPPRTKPKRG